MKRISLWVVIWFGSCISMWAQTSVPWNCNNALNKNLICLLPVATLGTAQGVQNSPAAAFNSTFATQLSQLPLVSPASGVGVLVTAGGAVEEYENLGPIMTDRAETIGRHKLFLGFFYQRFRFNAIDGTSLNSVPLVLTAANPQSGTQYIQETLNINFKLDQYSGVIAFGINKNTDVSMILPINRVSIGVGSSGTQYFFPTSGASSFFKFSQYVPGTSSGIGDIVANVKHTFLNGEHFKIAGGMSIRFPSGDALNYLGSGAYGFNPSAVFSYQWKVSPHARIAYLWNTSSVVIPSSPSGGSSQLPGGFQYDFGADWGVIKQLTIAGDFFGSQFLNSPYLLSGTTTIPTVPSSTTAPTLTATTRSYQVNNFSIGAKWRPFGGKSGSKLNSLSNLLLYGNALFQLNNVGLRSNVVPLVGISYKFQIGK